jgi:hypothetical protein
MCGQCCRLPDLSEALACLPMSGEVVRSAIPLAVCKVASAAWRIAYCWQPFQQVDSGCHFPSMVCITCPARSVHFAVLPPLLTSLFAACSDRTIVQ